MNIHESAEDYLEAILMLKFQLGRVRSIDIVNHLGVTKPSVSRAMKLLENDGYIKREMNRYLELTPKGLEIAESMYERHKFLSYFLMAIGDDETTATNDACRIEHVISEQSFVNLKKFVRQAIENQILDADTVLANKTCT
jgi:Mn-dependent DtxR family transcriptional regulator